MEKVTANIPERATAMKYALYEAQNSTYKSDLDSVVRIQGNVYRTLHRQNKEYLYNTIASAAVL